MKKLIENWSLPNRAAEKIPVSLRLPFDVYAKLYALKEAYPSQTVTDIATDILRKGLNDVIDALPVAMTLEECLETGDEHGFDGRQLYDGQQLSARSIFDTAYRRIFAEKSPKTYLPAGVAVLGDPDNNRCELVDEANL